MMIIGLLTFGGISDASAQLSVHASGVYHNHLARGLYEPNKMGYTGMKLGLSYQLHQRVAFDLSGAWYHFSERNIINREGGENTTHVTQMHLYNSSNSYCLEAAFLFYIMPEVLYLKAGYYLGTFQVQPDSGSVVSINDFTSIHTTEAQFHYVYGKGFDHGFLLGSGLQLLKREQITLDGEIMFRIGEVVSDRTDLISNVTKRDYKYLYFGFTPLIKVSFQLK